MSEVRFIADSNVGRLGKWLRVLGYDTTYGFAMTDEQIVRRALSEDRVILTRDTGIAARKIVKHYVLLTSDDTMAQLRQVVAELGLNIEPVHAFSRCIVCNELVVSVRKEAARDRIPPYVYSNVDEFGECPRCKRIYWHGTHVDNMLRDLDTCLADPLASEDKGRTES